jgi:hypothetical protein
VKNLHKSRIAAAIYPPASAGEGGVHGCSAFHYRLSSLLRRWGGKYLATQFAKKNHMHKATLRCSPEAPMARFTPEQSRRHGTRRQGTVPPTLTPKLQLKTLRRIPITPRSLFRDGCNTGPEDTGAQSTRYVNVYPRIRASSLPSDRNHTKELSRCEAWGCGRSEESVVAQLASLFKGGLPFVLMSASPRASSAKEKSASSHTAWETGGPC